MLDRIDEVHAANSKSMHPNIDEDEEYIAEFKNKSLGKSLTGSQAVKLKKMLEEGNLENEIRSSLRDDDLTELYGNEIADD